MIVIIGAGPAGIAAAVRARESGADVTIVDDNASPGGQIWRGQQDSKWFRRLRDAGPALIQRGQIVSGDASSQTLLVETPERAFELRYDDLILATGARELFLPFPGWTLPGVMGVGGLQAMAKSGLPLRGKRILVAGSGPLLLAGATYFRQQGAHVLRIAEQASRAALMGFALRLARHPGKLAQAARLRFGLPMVPVQTDCRVERAEGGTRVEEVHLRQGARTFAERVDYAAIGWGLRPNTQPAALFGCAADSSGVRVDESQRTSVRHVYAAGECTGVGGVDLSLTEGEIAGLAAAGELSAAGALLRRREQARHFGRLLAETFALREDLRDLPRTDTIVCRCEDVSFGQVRAHASFRAAKLHTRCGMGPCQGRICGASAEFLFGWKDESIRPPILPARIGSFVVGGGDGGTEPVG
jgi:NADPH-dependent 2,4-dienoyl-CoA reductase/sulfur reductase-like enzyme